MAKAKAAVAQLALPVTPPTVRVVRRGVSSLLDHELLAVVLGDESIGGLERSMEVLEDYGGLNGVKRRVRRADARHSALTEAEGAALAVAEELNARSQLATITRAPLDSPAAVRAYLQTLLADLQHEVFMVVFLDAQNRLIAVEELFRGTLTQVSVYPREVVKQALRHNAAAVILAHPHPSGIAEPSVQDQALTRTLAEALALVDVKVLDHFIVAPGGACASFAERGLI